MSQKQIVYDKLTAMGIAFGRAEHTAVYTIDEMRALGFPANVRVAKNLFLRDAKGKRHFLVVAGPDTPVDLKGLEQTLSCTKLSFASEERLQKYLGLSKGAVSPIGLINDTGRAVEVFLDKKLREAEAIGVHPNDNTATVFLSFDDLCRVIASTGHEVNIF
jgi:Ala-tRNA(Pro) deacylase